MDFRDGPTSKWRYEDTACPWGSAQCHPDKIRFDCAAALTDAKHLRSRRLHAINTLPIEIVSGLSLGRLLADVIRGRVDYQIVLWNDDVAAATPTADDIIDLAQDDLPRLESQLDCLR